MRYCKKCLMPDTRPGSIFDKDGICKACHNYEKRKTIDWQGRKKELKALCDKYRREDGYYDCAIPVSGGKDSHFLVYTIKVEMGMNPLLITVADPFTKTKAGTHNLWNLSETFNCDHVLFTISTDLFRRVTRMAFEEFCDPLRFVEAAIYVVPPKIALKYKIPLIVYGEDSAHEYGTADRQSPSAMECITSMIKNANIDFWLKRGISKKELNPIIPPSEEELKEIKLQPVFMSYFFPWSSVNNLKIAEKYGFKDLSDEWIREGCIENFEQIDSVAYLVHIWLKYPKFGFQRTSDIASRRIREGLLSLPEAKRLIMENDHKLDPRAMEDFIKFLGYTPEQFWNIVERFWNHEIFEKIGNTWRIKNPVYKDLVGEQTYA